MPANKRPGLPEQPSYFGRDPRDHAGPRNLQQRETASREEAAGYGTGRQNSTHGSLCSRFRQRETIREPIAQSGPVNHRSARSEFNRNPIPGPLCLSAASLLVPSRGLFASRLELVRHRCRVRRSPQASAYEGGGSRLVGNSVGIVPALRQFSEGPGNRDNFSHHLRVVAVPQPLGSLIARRVGMDHE